MIKPTETDVVKIINLTNKLKEIRYIQHRKYALTEAIATLNENQKWLLAFCAWHCLFNSRFKAYNTERLCLPNLPEVNESTFQDFIKLLRFHKNIKISPSREKPLLNFLNKCAEPQRTFYLSLIDKSWLSYFPVVELQTLLDLDSISGEKVYGELEYLKTSFADLKYPVSLRSVSSEMLKPYVMAKEPLSSMLLYFNGEGYRRVEKNSRAATDLELSVFPRFTVAGYYDSSTYYPCDYFIDWMECARYMHGGIPEDYETRIERLNEFIDNNILVYSDTSRVYLANNEQETLDAIYKLVKSGTTDILVSDSESMIEGTSYKIVCRVASGIIEAAFEDHLLLWFNGELIKCLYKFEGKEQALLTKPELLREKVMDFYFTKVGNTEYCFGKEIAWGRNRWRERRFRGSKIFIDKCALCGDTRHRHTNRGVCKSCEANLHYYWEKYGFNEWIPPSPQMQSKRYNAIWKPELLNVVKYRYKGTELVAREDGYWMFKKEVEDNGDGEARQQP